MIYKYAIIDCKINALISESVAILEINVMSFGISQMRYHKLHDIVLLSIDVILMMNIIYIICTDKYFLVYLITSKCQEVISY